MLKSQNRLTYSLKETIRYPDQALTAKLSGTSLHQDYNFLLLLKGIQAYNNCTGKIYPFLTIPKDQIPTISATLGLRPSAVKIYTNRLLKRGWLTEHANTYNIKALRKINSELEFQYFKTKNQSHEEIKYHSYRKLPNVQGIDLAAHRIYEIIKLKGSQFIHQVYHHPDNKSLSSVNQELINAIGNNKSVNGDKAFFGISLDSIMNYGGYVDKNNLWLKVNKMQLQGLKIKKDQSKFDRYKDRQCNRYSLMFEGTFLIKPKPILPKPKKLKSLNSAQEKFEAYLNRTGNRVDLIDAGILPRTYLKFTSTGKLIKIPVRCWSNILGKMLNHEFFKNILINTVGIGNIQLITETKKAFFSNRVLSDRYDTLVVDKVMISSPTGLTKQYDNRKIRLLSDQYRTERNKPMYMIDNPSI